MTSLLQKSVAEFIGTFALVFAGCGAIMVAERFVNSVPAAVIPLVFGLIVAAMIYSVGHISGAHFNPAVTMAFALTRHFPIRQIPVYWFAQFLGGLMAMSALWALLPDGEIFGATAPQVSFSQALAWEVVLSFFLMFVIIAVATDTRAEGTMAGAAIGITVMVCAYVGGPVTGASMNPARSFGPNLFQGLMDIYWIYLIGPIIGTSLAAWVYQWIRCHNQDQKGCC